MNNNLFMVLVLVLLSGCSTVGSNHPVKATDRILHPIDCTSGAKREECLAVANFDKKAQKKVVKPVQTEQIDRRARLAKIAESKKINDEKAKLKSEAAPLAQDNAEVGKPDLLGQKKIDVDDRQKDFAASMDCVRNNLGKVDDVRKPIRAVAFELAVLCRQKAVSVNSVANATIPLVSQSRAPKK